MSRLNREILTHLPAQLTLRASMPSQTAKQGIVHLGVGAFHRAHQALYTDKASADNAQSWAITGASLRSDQVQQQLQPQNCLYTVVERENDHLHYRLVQAIDQIIVAPAQPQRLIDAMAAPECKIIELTITEKGYCHHPASGRLDFEHPDIQHDLSQLDTPRSAPGFIVAALLQRRKNGLGGLSVLSCDNLPANGRLCRQVIIDFAEAIDDDLALWITEQVSFPCSMVDRIVPATTEADRQALAQALGYRDEAMVICEPFSQWVIEDNFKQGRPPWEDAGATFVADVHPFETLKLRLLNASHSAMAYLGFLAGYEYIYQVISDKDFACFIRYLMDEEITPTLNVPSEINLAHYKNQLLARFANRALQHRTQQIAMDGSQKLPQRLLQTIMQQLKQGGRIDGLCLAVAAWLVYTRGFNEDGRSYSVDDPLAETLLRQHQLAARQSGDETDQRAHHIVRAIFTIEEIFPAQLRNNTVFVETTQHFLAALLQDGARKTVSNFCHTRGCE